MPDASPWSFEGVYDAYFVKVRSYAARLIGRDEAEEVANEVFAKVARSLHSLADGSRLASWIYAITLNTVRDRARSRAARPREASLGTTPAADDPDRPALSEIADASARTPEETAIRAEMIDCYLDFVGQLAPRYQDVYVLSELEDLTDQEIADRLGLTVGTVKIRLHRARARLYERIRRDCRCYYDARGNLLGEPRRE